MLEGFSDPVPLPGGFSGETFLAEAAGEKVVVRIYGGRSLTRGPRASETDAAVLGWAGGVLPVPRVLDVRPGGPGAGMPGLLVTSYLPGVLLEDVYERLDDADLERVGRSLGEVLARLAGVALPREGAFDADLAITPFGPEVTDLRSWTEARLGSTWGASDLDDLLFIADDAQTRLDTVTRSCLVHSDLNPKNVLVDPDTLAVTGVLDWEFAHAGSPYADLGNLVRLHRAPAYVATVLATRDGLVPDPRPDALDLARAADLSALVDLASRAGENPVADRADRLLRAIAGSGDLHATD